LRKTSSDSFLGRIRELDKIKPVEIVFMSCDSVFIDPDMLRELSQMGIWTVLMGLDDKHKFAARREFGMILGQSTVAYLVDIYWTTWKNSLPLFEKTGARPVYLAEGADPAFHRPLGLQRDIDVLFLGQKYGNRARLISRLRSRGFKVVTAGNGWPEGFADFDKSLELVNRAKVVLGIGDVGYLSSVQHLKGRDFEIPMCGAVYLTTYNPELADWFEIGREILCYDSPQDCEEILRGLLNNPDKQRELRNAAVARSLKDHTWEHRIAKLFGLMKTE